MALSEVACGCAKIGPGVQLFRVRWPWMWFKEVGDAGPDGANLLGARKAWRCRWCEQPYAFLLIPYKSEEEILVRAESPDWRRWDWTALAKLADGLRWNGSGREAPRIL